MLGQEDAWIALLVGAQKVRAEGVISAEVKGHKGSPIDNITAGILVECAMVKVPHGKVVSGISQDVTIKHAWG